MSQKLRFVDESIYSTYGPVLDVQFAIFKDEYSVPLLGHVREFVDDGFMFTPSFSCGSLSMSDMTEIQEKLISLNQKGEAK